MISISGKAASGKDTILNELLNKGYKRIITYTTRPMRPGEIQDITYHYISDEDFEQKVQNGFFAEHQVYHTKLGDWRYGSPLKEILTAGDDMVVILTPVGVRAVKAEMSDNIFVLYIFANNTTIKQRLVKRGDNPIEAKRRFDQDAIDFNGFQSEADKIVYNNDGTDIMSVVDKVVTLIKENTKNRRINAKKQRH